MNRRSAVSALVLLGLSACQHQPVPVATPATASPYAGQEARPIKALSAEEVQGYLSGAGLGFAKAAELNGYPGPRHVLDLADSLALTPAQRQQIDARFRTMQAAAQTHGRAYVDAEAALDAAFARGTATRETLRTLTAEAARLEGEVRAAHLDAHLDMMAVLTPQQVAAYNRLRGYTGPSHSGGHEHHH